MLIMDQFIETTTKEAGGKLLEMFGTAKVLGAKNGVMDIVTEADVASQEILVSAIKSTYPDHGIVSEESAAYQTDADYVWYLDPLDGTKNFSTGVQLFGINLAVTYKNKLKYAAIYLPALNDFCWAEAGRGTYLNGKKVTCSEKQNWTGIYGLGSVQFSPKTLKFQQALDELSGHSAWTSAVACTAVSGIWMAAGKRDWYVSTLNTSWDHAAPALVAQEAGCVVTDFKGAAWQPGTDGLVVANKYLHPKLLELVQASYL